jgi:hypothetical protein
MANFTFNFTANSSTIRNVSDYTTFTANDIARLVTRSVGLFASLLTIAVMANPKLKNRTYKYLFFVAIGDFLYLSTIMMNHTIKLVCNPSSKCSSEANYASHFMTLAISDYLTSCLAIFGIVFEIFLTIDRILIIKNKKWLKNLKMRYPLIILIAFSLLFYLPVVFLKHIVAVTSENKPLNYKLTLTDYGSSKIGRLLPIILYSIRIGLVTIVLLALNITSIFIFRSYFNKKKNVSRTKSGKNYRIFSQRNRKFYL